MNELVQYIKNKRKTLGAKDPNIIVNKTMMYRELVLDSWFMLYGFTGNRKLN
jgi:hypothetical protein